MRTMGLVCLLLLGVVAFCTILGFKNGTISSTNVPSSSREVSFISEGSDWMNLWRTSPSPALNLLAVDISSCRYAEGLPIICALAINFPNISGFVLSCLVITASFSPAYSFEAKIVDGRRDTASGGKSDNTRKNFVFSFLMCPNSNWYFYRFGCCSFFHNNILPSPSLVSSHLLKKFYFVFVDEYNDRQKKNKWS